MNSHAAPCVTAIMPVYNTQAYVAASIQSVLAQSFTDFELIIVDDGGTDRSLEICQSFAGPRIRIISQSNRGLAGARNTGIAAARGRYVALLDSDDLWAPDKLAIHVAHLNANPEIGVSYAAAALIDESGAPLGITQRPKLGAVTAQDVFCGRAILNGSVPVFRTKMLYEAALPGGAGRTWFFDETLRRCEDVECWTRLALRSQLRFAPLPDILTYYRINASGLSADVPRQLAAWDEMCGRLAAQAPGFIAAHRGQARARELRYLARRCVAMNSPALGLKLLAQSLAHHPRLLWDEPGKTCTTFAACLALKILPKANFQRLHKAARLLRP